ncbi:hypothetical protein AAFP35_07275 [Gordonia sp. CPCC 206044]|uniref:hypothetical protein n=1 Tax=Gordonia sp. CPCC 206044 TaxID=3140793 RepID=UPI003AF37F8A
MHRTTRTAAVAGALCTAAIPALVATPASAAPAATQLCSISYPNPNLMALYASSVATAESAGTGRVTLRLVTDAKSIIGYRQQFRVVWSNLDTGKSGVANTTARVAGSRTVLSLPPITTGTGRITAVLGTTNTGALNPQAITNGDCVAEYPVR